MGWLQHPIVSPEVLQAPGLLPLAPPGQEQLHCLGGEQVLQGTWLVPGPQRWLQRWEALVHTLSQGLPGRPGPRRGGGCALGHGALAGGGRALSVAGVLSRAQLRQLEMQLEQEYEEKQMVLHEKQDLEGLIGTLCEQVRGWRPPQGQPGGAAGGEKRAPLSLLLAPGQPNGFAGRAPAQNAARKKGRVNACMRVDRATAWLFTHVQPAGMPSIPRLFQTPPVRAAACAAAGTGCQQGFGTAGII